MIEIDRALVLATQVLDRVDRSGDPDDDIAILARQLLRTKEALEHWRSESERRANKCDELQRDLNRLTDAFANALEADDQLARVHKVQIEMLEGDRDNLVAELSTLRQALHSSMEAQAIIEKDRNDLLGEVKKLYKEVDSLRRLESKFMEGELKGV